MTRLLLCVLVFLGTGVGLAGDLTVLTPPVGERAYQIAGNQFADLWHQVTGQRPAVQQAEIDQRVPPAGDVILIGSDAVHPIVHTLIHDAVLDGLELQYGGDNYRILSVPLEGRQLVIVAGGSGRSTIYAVYDFFRRQAGAEYFWDGDRIPRRDAIELAGIDVLQKPHFGYRGLRYFAHRGLHRFQAEHWDLEDWQREIDWMMKERFNLFMLRTGIDDLFQRAFPDEVTYPRDRRPGSRRRGPLLQRPNVLLGPPLSRRAPQAGPSIRPGSRAPAPGRYRHDHPLVLPHAQFLLQKSS